MRVYYDCEFIDDGRTIDLVSIGAVREDGLSYYAISSEFDKGKFLSERWMVQNVLPYLPFKLHHKIMDDHGSLQHDAGFELTLVPLPDHPDVNLIKDRATIRQELGEFIYKASTYRSPISLWGYFSAHDHICLTQLWGPMVKLPPHIPQRTNDLQQEASRLGVSRVEFPRQGQKRHNALEDARWHKELHDFLQTRSRG